MHHKYLLYFTALLYFVILYKPAYAQDAVLKQQLAESHYLKTVMKPDSASAALPKWQAKKPLLSRVLPLAEDFSHLQLKGPGTMRVDHSNTISGKGSVLVETPTSLPVKNPSNRSYASAELVRPLDKENLQKYNRLSVWVYADAGGFYSFFCGFTIYNEGKHIMPTPGRFEGQHFVNVYPHKWTHIVWEIPDLYRDSVTGFSVSIMLTGSPKGADTTMKMYVDDMRIEQVEAENTRGFNLRNNAIAYSNSGYKTGARKQAITQNVNAATFTLVDAHNKTAYTGKTKQLDNGFVKMDFSGFNTPGYYTLKVGNRQTGAFAIGNDAYLATAWHTLNFFFAERCGYDQPGVHQACHLDAKIIHPDGRSLPISGGWHDAADVTQGTGNTCRGGIAMLELARSVKDKDPDLYCRLLEEARWGLDWTMQTSFGDGYRVGGLIMGIWSDGITGTKDDMQGKASYNASDNFLTASYYATAVPFYLADDPVFANLCRNAAVADFGFAVKKLASSINANNETEMYAQATVTAMHLYRLTKQQNYLDSAARYAHFVMDGQQLQRRTDWSIPLHGFFYESREKKRIQAYFHRSNEELMVQGIAMLLTDAPNHADAALWKASCQAYADYLHDIAGTMQPYGTLPSAIYEVNNAEFEGIYHEGDRVGMPSMEEYNAQVKNGVNLGGNFYLRRFPVAYQFRGFHAVLLAKAKAAFILADVLHDRSLKDIATRQVEYIVGYNPFASSTIYGDGNNYISLYGGYAGDVVGAVPVGIETFENDDEPYMPMQVNATYKEIWTFSTASVIWSLAQLFKDAKN